MATVRVEWITSHGPTVNKNQLARQEAAKQKELEQAVADAKHAAERKEAWDAAGEQFKTRKATELERSLQEYRVTQAPGYVAPELCMYPDGKQRAYRRRTLAEIMADAEATLDKGK